MTSSAPPTTAPPDTTAAMASALLPGFRAALRAFTVSPAASFQHIRSTAAAAPPSTASQLFVLDSSFNPPTRAHFRIALSAFSDRDAATPAAAAEKRLLLLLATNNADKAPNPAPFDDRLAMMTILSSEISAAAASSRGTGAPPPAAVDVALTKHARFLDKAHALRTHYPGARELVFLTGFDTLVRIFDPRYYPEAGGHRLDALAAFFERGVVWCMFREGEAAYGGRAEQEAWLDALGAGALEGVGGRREWARRVRFIENDAAENDAAEKVVVSSTRVREAVKAGGGEVLEALLTEGVRGYVLERGLYVD
ncbi:hypothetical protein DFP73DRAFT_567684 [Morchella snyderi]|nr:hypothetical protein DFP73DRAFT_567684 [Morchella snyderi]